MNTNKKLRVFVDPIPKLGIAMRRVSLALAVTAPDEVELVDNPRTADVQVLHPVGTDVLNYLVAPRYAVMMHCLDAVQGRGGSNVPIISDDEPWRDVWSGAELVWSYYPIQKRIAALPEPRPAFYGAPLGVDGTIFKLPTSDQPRDIGAFTTGYVSGPQAEAIEEVALAAYACGMTTVHLGPAQVAGMDAIIPGWMAVSGISDEELAAIYGRTKWVSGLRHVEGFELPIIEGLACGARPICFDLPVYRRWFEGHAVFVPESDGATLTKILRDVMSKDPEPVTPAERQAVVDRFNWLTIGEGFWAALLDNLRSVGERPHATSAVSVSVGEPLKRSLIWIGDSPTTPHTGFGRASYHIGERLRQQFDMTFIGTTHSGEPYDRVRYPYDVWPLSNSVIADLVSKQRPDAVVIQHDPWQVRAFMAQVGLGAGSVPVIASMPIDGKNCRCDYLNGIALAVWWTNFAAQEAAAGGYSGDATVVPLGVDVNVYKPVARVKARRAIGLPAALDDAFIVGYIARNQPRKRMDIAVSHFADWVKSRGVRDAYLLIQAAPTAEAAYDVSELMRYERLSNRLILDEPDIRRPVPEQKMAMIYSALDVFWSTSQGEGWGLPALEAMACAVPCVLPDYAAYGDWARDGADLVPIAEIAATINPSNARSRTRIGVIGGVPSRSGNIEALDRLYRDRSYRTIASERAFELAQRPEYRWDYIGDAFARAITTVLDDRPTAPPPVKELAVRA